MEAGTMRDNAIVVFSLLSLLFVANQIYADAIHLEQIKLPPGFTIAVYTDKVPNAREMTLGKNGTVFVGSMSKGDVYALVDSDGDARADKIYTIASGLQMPVGVAYRNGSLYVSAVDRILRFDEIEQRLANPPKPVIVTDRFPHETHHGWKFLAFGPDGKLYVPVGAPCNVCMPPGPLHATITRVDLAGGRPEVVARSVRNSVGLDFHPSTGEPWFTANGRAMLGDDQPADD